MVVNLLLCEGLQALIVLFDICEADPRIPRSDDVRKAALRTPPSSCVTSRIHKQTFPDCAAQSMDARVGIEAATNDHIT
jgi:hypothetical protein